MVNFQTRFGNATQSAPEMLRRLFAHNLFLNTESRQIQEATGKPHKWARRWVKFTHKIAPWFLFVSLGLLVPVAGWFSLIFIPFFLVGYFLFSLQSVRNGGIKLPSFILITANALPWIPQAEPGISAFLATFAGALWCNRFSWWYADYALSKNPMLGQLFRNKPQEDSSHSGIADAEVVEVSDI